MKIDYPPLFGPGIHEIANEELEKHFVEPFEVQDHRQWLVSRFRALVNRITELGIGFEVWIDGSFATEKPNPEDVDALFLFDAEVVNTGSELVQSELASIFGEDGRVDTRLRYSCDVYVIASTDENLRSYWRGWFGFTRDEKPKGIPCMRIGR
jgi:hypothetical protein